MLTKHNHTTTMDSVFRPLLTALNGLVRQLRNQECTNDDAEEVLMHLETLPLSSDQYRLANNHLANAQLYLRSNETGAAQWELTALKQQLRTHLKNKAHQPRNRGL